MRKLSLQKKADILKRTSQPTLSKRSVAHEFHVTEKTIRRIVNNKVQIEKLVSESKLLNRCQVNTRAKYQDINEMVFQWYCSMEENCGSVPLTDAVIITFAKRTATKMCINEFKASNGWLRSWKARYSIKSRKASLKWK